MTPQDFINQIAPAARACQNATGVPASFTIAQAALESAWGSRAPGNNLFGVKADSAWKGATVDVPTHEFINGKSVAITAKFRAYKDWAGSLIDHAAFFHANPRYHACFSEKTGPGFARAVAAAGYATDPDYASKLTSTIAARNLTQYDTP